MEVLSRLRRFVAWHRRWIAAGLAGLGVLIVVSALSSPAGATSPAVVTVTAVSAGQVLGAGDVAVVQFPVGSLPERAATDTSEVVGSTAGVALAANSIIQHGLLAGGTPAAPGRALVPVVVPDERLASLLTPGMPVSLVQVSAEGATVLTGQAVVAALPAQPEGSGLMPTVGRAPMLLVDVPADVAPDVAVLGQRGDLSILLGHN